MEEHDYFGSGNSEPDAPQPTTPTPPPKLIDVPEPALDDEPKSSKRWLLVTLMVLAILAIIGGTAYYEYRQANEPTPAKKTAAQITTTPASTPSTTAASATVPGLQLDTAKSYGNKYANGLLPVGDGKYVTTGAKQGYVYTCAQYAQNFQREQGGAGTRGPWFTNNNTQYDINKKAHVSGSVSWNPVFNNNLSGTTRTITTNDLPNHPTGVFPIAASDVAYAYDRNPNSISARSLTYALPGSPTYGNPSCMGGEAGVMLTGVALFNAFDAGGRDAGAWEVQDSCSGHPQKDGEYHYHTLSSCIKDTSVHTVIGYALDGFPITGPQVGTNNILTTSDLDECHGIVSSVLENGKSVTTYHYVMTQDFPYSVSCFRGQAIQPPNHP